VGFAVAEGRFPLDDAATGIVGRGDARIQVRDLGTMTTGHAEDTAPRMIDGSGGDWVGGFIRLPTQHEPGTHLRTSFVRTFVCTLARDDLTIVAQDNVSFGPTGYAPVLAVGA